MRVSLGVEDSQNMVKPSDGDYDIKTIVEYENPPPLSEFNKDELKDILQTFKEAKIKDSDLFFERDGIPLLVEDVRKLDNDDTTSHRTIAMFVYYLNLLQKNQRMKYNKSNGNRCYYAAINLLNYDKFYKTTKYQYFFGFRNHYIKNPTQIYNDYDKCLFIFKHDGRWIVLTVELATHCFFIADFLSEDLSHSKYDELLDISKTVAVNEYKLKYATHEFYDAYKLNFYNDCGIYVLTYLYKALNNESIDTIKVQPKEKELFRNQLVWLFLRMKLLRKKEIQMMPFPHTPDPNKSNRKTDKMNNSMTHIINNNGVLEQVNRSPRIPHKRDDDDDTHSTLSILKELDKNPNLSVPDLRQSLYQNQQQRPQFNQNQNPYQYQQPQPQQQYQQQYQQPKSTHQTRNPSMVMPIENNNKDASILEFKKDELQNLLEQFKQDLIDKMDKNNNKKKKDKDQSMSEGDESMRSSNGMQKNQKGGYPGYPSPYPNPYQNMYLNPYQNAYQYPNQQQYPNPQQMANAYSSPFTNPYNQHIGYPSYDSSDYSSYDESSASPSVMLGKKPRLRGNDNDSVFDTTERTRNKYTKSITAMSDDDDDEDSRITDLRNRLTQKAQNGSK